jgi:hypothetical protein
MKKDGIDTILNAGLFALKVAVVVLIILAASIGMAVIA